MNRKFLVFLGCVAAGGWVAVLISSFFQWKLSRQGLIAEGVLTGFVVVFIGALEGLVLERLPGIVKWGVAMGLMFGPVATAMVHTPFWQALLLCTVLGVGLALVAFFFVSLLTRGRDVEPVSG